MPSYYIIIKSDQAEIINFCSKNRSQRHLLSKRDSLWRAPFIVQLLQRFSKKRLIKYFLSFCFVLYSWFNFSGDGSSNSNKFAQYPRPKIVPVDYNKKKQVCVCEQCGGSWSRKEYYYHHKSVGKCTPKWIRYRWGSSDYFTNLEFQITKKFDEYIFWFLFSTGKLKKKLFWTNKRP